MQGVAFGVNETVEIMQNQLLQTEAIVEQVDKAKTVSHTITDDIRETEESITIGKQNVDNLLACVNKSVEASTVVAAKMNELSENTEKMNSIVEIINSVTNQTSLLSLNASIEAARAGEAGKGFAVVATEISNLAKQTSDATISITALIKNITNSIHEVFTSMNMLVESNTEQNHSVAVMAETFEKIESNAGDMSAVSLTLNQVVNELVKLNEATVGYVDNVSSVTQEVSSRASHTLSGTEKDAIVVDEILKVIVEINDKVKKLNQ